MMGAAAAVALPLLPHHRPAAPLPLPADEASVRWISDLDTDSLSLICDQLGCAYALAAASGVCRAWRATIRDRDELWAELCRARWGMAPRAGKYKYGERLWREVFRVSHRRMRVPDLNAVAGLAPREVAYASGRGHRVCVWVFVSHAPACRLSVGASGSLLATRVLVQNLRQTGIDLDPAAGISLRLCEEGRVVAADGYHRQPEPVRLAPMGCAVFDVTWVVPKHMHFEPDALEAARTLRVEFGRRAPPHEDCGTALRALEAAVRAGANQDDWFDVTCEFDPDLVWRHYEQITAGFYAHHDERCSDPMRGR